MDALLKNDLKDIGINQLMHTPLGDKLEQAQLILKKIKANCCGLAEKQDELGLTGIKAATVITFAILKKIGGGKKPSEFTADDWKDIANDVSNDVVLKSDRAYSVYVFNLYEKYIRYSTKMISKVVPEKTVKAVYALADELRREAENLQAGVVSESKYVENCLWISLEAMVKLLASTAVLCGDAEKAEYVQAAASYAFEYGRLMLYRREQEIVDQFIESQYQMDAELEARYSAYLNDLQKETEQFRTILDNAFSPDCRTAFLQSVLLAKTVGVKEDEILSSTEDIDDFFLS